MLKRFIATCVLLGGMGFTAAMADEFNPETGTGFFGKGTITEALGIENISPADAEEVVFELRKPFRYSTMCREKGVKPNHDQTFKRKRALIKVLEANPRINAQQNQNTGFDLVGFTGEEKLDGRFCPKGWRAIGEPQLLREYPARVTVEFEDNRAPIWFE